MSKKMLVIVSVIVLLSVLMSACSVNHNGTSSSVNVGGATITYNQPTNGCSHAPCSSAPEQKDILTITTK